MKLTEIFYSLQGEGINIGKPTVFIRFTGCNLDCSWCDTDYARQDGKSYGLEDVLKELSDKFPACRHVCITGGEPLCQMDEVKALMQALLQSGYRIDLETNGAVDISPLREIIEQKTVVVAMDVKTPSSREQDSFIAANLALLKSKDMLKFIIADEKDYGFSKKFIEHRRPDCRIIFTAEGGTELGWLAEKILEDKLEVRLLPQLHKLIWGPDARGR